MSTLVAAVLGAHHGHCVDPLVHRPARGRPRRPDHPCRVASDEGRRDAPLPPAGAPRVLALGITLATVVVFDILPALVSVWSHPSCSSSIGQARPALSVLGESPARPPVRSSTSGAIRDAIATSRASLPWGRTAPLFYANAQAVQDGIVEVVEHARRPRGRRDRRPRRQRRTRHHHPRGARTARTNLHKRQIVLAVGPARTGPAADRSRY